MRGIPVKDMSWHHWLSGAMAIALHGGAIALIGMHWEGSRVSASLPPAGQVIPIRLSFTPPEKVAEVEGTYLAASPFNEIIQPSLSQNDVSQHAGGEQADHYALPSFYFPASELDVRPYPEAPVVIPFPDVALEEERVEGVLVLYIDIEGKVDRVEIQESTLPSLLERTAMSTFMQAKMQPGMKEGKAVRSQMKVLVEFESRNAF